MECSGLPIYVGRLFFNIMNYFKDFGKNTGSYSHPPPQSSLAVGVPFCNSVGNLGSLTDHNIRTKNRNYDLTTKNELRLCKQD